MSPRYYDESFDFESVVKNLEEKAFFPYEREEEDFEEYEEIYHVKRVRRRGQTKFRSLFEEETRRELPRSKQRKYLKS